ncbi:SDR family NAD(P)-dependent oxidoreductase [Aliikangiella coralliicola]|uniref:SDR family NAD(P)-dependent oxidoreductase n=1 Tax=Aliikangiella coralliicola TaxID=2592383 RepID=A0A545U601_9GAMM|nr:SDR family NAD(P)-dependent oxidoreductase [Aliikangiella coralliicola]TQV84898.1 SDR family NAD(P)-dependent oxidoreductase [Aliikangiella coralliicola]
MSFENTIAVVSGGASGLGLGVINRIVEQGGKAAILDINTEQGEAVAAQHPEQLMFIKTDISNEQEVDAAVDQAVEKFGKINLAVGCAGILGAGRLISKKGPMPASYFQKVIDINLMGTFLLTRAAAKHMHDNQPESGERGVIVHTASIAAFEGQFGQVAYSATKSAIVGMMLPLAREFSKSGIRCMAIAPGSFETPMIADVPDDIREQLCATVPFPSRFGKAEEFAQLVQQIVENQMLNGTVIRLDGAARLQ